MRIQIGNGSFILDLPGYSAPAYVQPALPSEPAAWSQSISDVCIDAANINVSTFTATPSGGTYSGTGIVGTSFSPTTAGAGTHTITYTAPDGSTATNTITVNPLPTVTIVIDATTLSSPPWSPIVNGVFFWAPPFDITNIADPIGGTFSGSGVSGTTFTARIAGIGTHGITYSFSDANTCTTTIAQSIQVFGFQSPIPPGPFPLEPTPPMLPGPQNHEIPDLALHYFESRDDPGFYTYVPAVYDFGGGGEEEPIGGGEEEPGEIFDPIGGGALEPEIPGGIGGGGFELPESELTLVSPAIWYATGRDTTMFNYVAIDSTATEPMEFWFCDSSGDPSTYESALASRVARYQFDEGAGEWVLL